MVRHRFRPKESFKKLKHLLSFACIFYTILESTKNMFILTLIMSRVILKTLEKYGVCTLFEKASLLNEIPESLIIFSRKKHIASELNTQGETRLGSSNRGINSRKENELIQKMSFRKK